MFRKILLLLILFAGAITANETDDFNYEGGLNCNNKPLFVSLGANCEMALRLRDCGLRDAAFPFDWLVSRSVDSFVELLDHDFESFLDEKCYVQLDIDSRWVKNTVYDIVFIHDWPFTDTTTSDPLRFAQQIEAIQIKYERRINRFRKIKQYQGKVFFFRTFWFEEGDYVTHQNALDIKGALDRYFPELDFTLVIVNFTDSNAPDIDGIDEVIEFKIRREHNLHDWQVMCSQLLNNL